MRCTNLKAVEYLTQNIVKSPIYKNETVNTSRIRYIFEEIFSIISCVFLDLSKIYPLILKLYRNAKWDLYSLSTVNSCPLVCLIFTVF